MKNIFIQSISSDIGVNLARAWTKLGHKIYGTYRTRSLAVEELETLGVRLTICDLASRQSIDACSAWVTQQPHWDVAVIGAGTQEPIGNFEETSIDEWEMSIYQNFTGQLRLIHGILRSRNLDCELTPRLLMFAGGGTNGTVKKYSAYTISKIASIKMCELLDAEIENCAFTIIGPGWVKTKIHEATLRAGSMAGSNYQKTKDMLNGDLCNPMERVVDCCSWIIDAEKTLISGRNFSVVHDPWDKPEINNVLKNNNNFKLRRFGNYLLDTSN